jgi:beta-lactamase regulating signal transducer with metallopeptidase domain
MPTAAALTAWLWQTTWQIFLLAVVVAAVTWALRKRLSPQARQLLWMLVFVRAVMPVLPGSPLSLYGLLKREPAPAAPVIATQRATAHVATSGTVLPAPPPETATPLITLPTLLLAGWALGGACLLAAVLISTFSFSRRLRQTAQAPSNEIFALVQRSADELHLKTPGVLLTDLVSTPAIFSAAAPVLLLPGNVANHLKPADLRSVILHELEHIRRHHLRVEWLLTLIRAAHWFNPTMWLAHRQIRACRELICDQAVLARLDSPSARQYGLTMLKLAAGRLTTPRGVPMAAFAKQHKLLRQRIEAIAGGKGKYIAGLGVIVAMVLSVFLLTRPSEPPTKISSSLPTTRSSQNIAQLVRDARSLVEQQRYEEALGAIDVILKFDPNNDYALGARPLVEDRAIVAQQRRYIERPPGTAVADEQPVPYSDALRYPDNWPDLPPPRARSTTDEAVANATTMKLLEHKLPEVRFDNVGFADVIDFFRDVGSANIFVDWRALEAAGIDRNAPVTIRLRDVKLSKALEVVLLDVGAGKARLGYAVDGGIVTISTVAGLPAGAATEPATQPAGAAANDAEAATLLDRPFPEVRFDDVALADVLDFIRDNSVNIAVDWPALEASGINRRTSISARLHDAKLGQALETVLLKAGGTKATLGYKIDQGVITISTAAGPPAAAADQPPANAATAPATNAE